MGKTIRRFAIDILTVFGCYVVFTTAGWGSYNIVSGSMEPTLEVGDRIMVSKFSYGYNRYSVMFSPKFLGTDRLFASLPERGDIALFHLPDRDKKDVIKRVIGLPGDTVQMKAGRLYINGTVVPRTSIRALAYTNYQGYERRVKEYDETLPDGVTHRIYEETDRGRYDDTALYVVPQGHYFMMGDNRDGSADSRILNNMGYVKAAYITGKALRITYSTHECTEGKDQDCAPGDSTDRSFMEIR
ncbi:MAG: signal peptidase I [Alphaproteobacteria bacterium]|nr:MAG: signal peptidase I [Alphaproteobacteria bacterium]